MTQDLVLLKKVKEKGLPKGQCKIVGCEIISFKSGFCRSHYGKIIRGTMKKDGTVVRKRAVDRYPPDFGCIVCGNTGKITRGFCRVHYGHYQKGAIDYDGIKIRELKRVRKYNDDSYCKVPGCGKRAMEKWMCRGHRSQFKRGIINENGVRLVPALFKNKGAKCRGENCDRPAITKGLCTLHYSRSKPGYVGPDGYKNVGKQCSIIACKNKAHSRTMCPKHYLRFMRKKRLREALVSV